ncbi:hypothetical protein [Spiroplasma endosymbiont of Othius punctulatus]|uniref:hypothetical protein n=1 Tax=Spiroplasma endosymbiont of Othius punctulatus TaxID=3066289 RepID=UPI0030D2A08E
MNEKFREELINNKACELSLDESYYEKLYISFVLNYSKELNVFINNNKKVLDGWFNKANNSINKKSELFVDMLVFTKTVKLKDKSEKIKDRKISAFEIDYSFLKKYVSVKNKKEVSLIWKTAEIIESDINNSIRGESDSSIQKADKYNHFFELFKQHQILLNFILDEEFRKKAIYDNLVYLSNIKSKVSEEFAIQKTQIDQNKFKSLNHQ